METAIQVVVTCILLAGICAVWSGSIDVTKTIRKPLEWLVSFKKEMHLDVDFKQILAANMRGQPCLLFYDLHFVNATGENLTVKKIVLRAQKPAGGQLEINSTVVTTGEVREAKGTLVELIVVQIGPANIVLIGWKNLRLILSHLTTLSPGAVFAGSAVFILEGMSREQVKQMQSVELVAVDYSGNEAIKKIDIDPQWLEQLDTAVVADRSFIDEGRGPVWR